jgi:hypothetical protein
MNVIELEPARVNALNNWFLKPEAGDLLICLEKSAQKAMMEFAELRTKSKADNNNANFSAAAELKLVEASEYETAVKVLKAFFPDGPFISRIEL